MNIINNDKNRINGKSAFTKKLNILGGIYGGPEQKEATKPFKFNGLIAQIVRPWGVEPQSMEPESIILSIELWAHSILIL